MVKNKHTGTQPYPRINDENSKFFNCLDDSKLKEHCKKIPIPEIETIILNAIQYASKKSGRSFIKTIDGMTIEQVYEKTGIELFKYFKKFCGDPASTAHSCFKRHYSVIGKQQCKNLLLQKQRMNSGWRFQYIAKAMATKSERFSNVSDLALAEADFNASVLIKGYAYPLNIYVSVKNRASTLGGQDWPKAIFALEQIAQTDKNRLGPYICVFGIAMDKGHRYIKFQQKTKRAHSINTEIWLSDFFWPFFTNYSFEEIINIVLTVLLKGEAPDEFEFDVPSEIIESFGKCCRKFGLLNEKGFFNDPYKLVSLFCGSVKNTKK